MHGGMRVRRALPPTQPVATGRKRRMSSSPATNAAGARSGRPAMTGKRNVIDVADDDTFAKTAAERLLARIAQAGERPAIALTGGSSPEGMYRLLAQEPYRSRVAWERVHWF